MPPRREYASASLSSIFAGLHREQRPEGVAGQPVSEHHTPRGSRTLPTPSRGFLEQDEIRAACSLYRPEVFLPSSGPPLHPLSVSPSRLPRYGLSPHSVSSRSSSSTEKPGTSDK